MKSRKTLVISVLLLGIAAGVSFILLLSDFLIKNSIKQQVVFYETLGKNFARNAANAIATKDVYSLKMFARDMSQAENVVYAVVSDDTGKEIVKSESGLTCHAGKLRDVTIPIDIMGAKWGGIKIGFSTESLAAEADRVRKYVFGFGFFIMVAVIAYVFFFPNTLIIPVMKMTSKGLVGEEQRRFTRTLTNIIVECSINQLPPAICKMTDISISGMKLIYPDNMVMNKDDKVELNFKLLAEPSNSGGAPHRHESKMQDYSIKGFVKWVAGGKEKSCGIEFEAVNLVDRIKLADFINYTKTNHEDWVREKLNEIENASTIH